MIPARPIDGIILFSLLFLAWLLIDPRWPQGPSASAPVIPT